VATSDIVVLQVASLAVSLVVVSVLLSVQEAVVVVVHGFTVLDLATPHDNGGGVTRSYLFPAPIRVYIHTIVPPENRNKSTPQHSHAKTMLSLEKPIKLI